MSRGAQIAVAVFLVVAAGFPLGWALTRRAGFALLLAPLVSALTASAAVIGMLAGTGPFALWLGIAFAAQFAGAAMLLRRRIEPLAVAGPVEVLWLALPLAPPFLLAWQSPTRMWDSQMIWWMHGAVFAQGSDFAREIFTHPLFFFTHPIYPPAASATVGGVWTVLPGFDLFVAQFVSVTLTFSALGMLAYAMRFATRHAPKYVSRVAAACMAIPVWAVNKDGVATGYSDVLWAASFGAAVLLILIVPGWTKRPVLPVLLLSVAALTKNEGLLSVGVLAVVVTLWRWRRLREVWPVWVPVAAGLSWLGVARAFGAKSDLAGEGFLGRVTDLGTLFDKTGMVVSAALVWGGKALAASAVIAVIGLLFQRGARRRLGLGSDLWLWLFFALYFGLVLSAYLGTANDLTWHLETSIDRVITPLMILLMASTMLWAVTALTPGQTSPGQASAADLPVQRESDLGPAQREKESTMAGSGED